MKTRYLKGVFPLIHVVDDTLLVHEGPVYPGCGLAKKVTSLTPGKRYLCSVFGASLTDYPLLFMFTMCPAEEGKVKVIMSFYPFKPEHECKVEALVDHLLRVIEIHNDNRRAAAQR